MELRFFPINVFRETPKVKFFDAGIDRSNGSNGSSGSIITSLGSAADGSYSFCGATSSCPTISAILFCIATAPTSYLLCISLS